MRKSSGRREIVVVTLLLTLLLAGLSLIHPAAPTTDIGNASTAVATVPAVQPQPIPTAAAEAPSVQPSQAEAVALDGAIDEAPYREFDEWALEFIAASDDAAREATVEMGKTLAEKRSVALKALIRTQPEEALKRIVPVAMRLNLPAAITSRLERRVSGRGKLGVIAALTTNGATYRREAEINGEMFEAHTFGRLDREKTRTGISLHGVAVGSTLALSNSPVRLLEPGEQPRPGLKIGNVEGGCPVSGKLASREIIAESGDTIYYLCSGGHIMQLEKQVLAQEGGDGTGTGGEPPIAQSAWTFGNKTVLFIRVNYPDDLTDPQSLASSQSMMQACSDFMLENSYGVASMTTTVTPLFTLPQTKAYYTTNGDSILYADARAVAKANGYDYVTYNLDCVRFQGGPGSYGGQAYVGARGCWLKHNSAGVAAHEFGHNYGLWHANSWNPTTDNPIGSGTHQEYGDQYDTMGSAAAGNNHFNTYEKNRLDWLPTANVTTVTASGTYRIHAHDQAVLGSNKYALKITKDSDRDYWINFRQKHTSNKWMMNGADLHWDPWASSASGSHLIDTTAQSPDGKNDSAIVIGRTFSDPYANIHFTPKAKGGTTPESLDVVVNIGPFPGNVAPTATVNASATTVATNTTVNLSVSASDANGDPLAYYWEFGDGNFGTNAATQTKSWTTAGKYAVRCTVSDMKGGIAIDTVVITVGAPTTFTVSGTVRDASSNPMVGVRIHNGLTGASYRGAFTNSDGTYTVTNLAAGSYTFGAGKAGYTFAANGFTNPVTVGPDQININFTGTQTLYTISGKITDGSANVAGVVVSDGTRSATTDSAGNYTLASVPDGAYTLTATKPGYAFNASPANPVTVAGANVANRNFSRILWTVSGTISGVNAAPVVDIGDGIHTATSFKNGANYNYNISVPQGTWTLKATLAGFVITPSNFTNPLTVTAFTSNRNFSGTAGTAYSISGNITSLAAPLSGVVVSDGTRSSTSDSIGNYTIVAVPAGSYTLTPTLSGFSFTPATRAVTVSTANITGQNFATTTANTAPTISNIADRTINEDSNTGAVAFTIGDAETAVTSLTVSGSSSNTTLVPNANIVFGGSGANRTVTVAPAANQSGTATITVTVSDGALTDNDTFVLTVTAVNDTPTISNIADQSTGSGTATAAIPFTVGDLETAAASLTVSGSSSNTTLVPNANIVFGGSGASRTVTVTPAGSLTGTSTITVTVSDGGLTASDTFVLTVTATNTAPTISNIADLTINEDSNTGALAFTIGDAQTAATSLTVSGSSSNTTLVPNANIVFGGSGASRTVTVTPAANQSGTATITVTVSDGALTASDTFVLTVTAVNDTPTISNIADQSTGSGTATAAIPFTVGDVETAAASLTVSGSSSNTTLVPNANIVFGGSGASRTVTVTPAGSLTGTATITVTVSDGSLTASDTFVLTVSSTNTAPTISNIADLTINEDTNTGALAFTVGDAQTAATSLTVSGSSSNTTLVPNANIVFGGSGASRTVTVTPAANQSGTATITVTVSDGSLSASDTFVLTVTAVNDTPTISNIADRTINEDTNTGAVAFTVGDVETAATSLTVSGSSSNTTLVPSANIVFGGSGTSRTVTVTLAAGLSGTATITVTVSDGSLSASDTFVLTVTGVNDAPTISAIASQSTNEDTAKTGIAVTVGDAETAAASLTLSGTSSNTTLVPNANITFGGSGASRTVNVTPAANQNGVANITVTVSDGSLTASTTFQLTVTAVNDAPVIGAGPTLAPSPALVGQTVTLSVTATDVDSASLTYTINWGDTTSSTGSGTGSGTTHAWSTAGSKTVTYTVSDGTLTASKTVSLTVNAANTAPVAANQTVTTRKNTPVAITLSATDAESNPLTYAVVAAPARGVLAGTAPNLTYTPQAGYSGSDSFTFRANDGSLNSNLATVTINITRSAPKVNSTASALPNPATVAQSVAFSVAASDDDGDALTYAWDFGDGAGDSNANPSHSYTVPGTYVALLTVTDVDGLSVGASVSVTVNGDGGGGGGGGGVGGDADSDGDGVSDANEIADGTNPRDPNSFKAVAMTVSKVSGKMSFVSSGKDACSITGVIPDLPAKFVPAGSVVTVSVGGAVVTYALDAKGRARNANGTAQLSLKPAVRNPATKMLEFVGGPAPIKISMKNGSWAAAWSDEGADPAASVTGQSMSIVINLYFNGRLYTATVTPALTTKAGVGGKFSN